MLENSGQMGSFRQKYESTRIVVAVKKVSQDPEVQDWLYDYLLTGQLKRNQR